MPLDPRRNKNFIVINKVVNNLNLEERVVTVVNGAEQGPRGPAGLNLEIEITNPQDGDILVYNATTGKWVNQQP